MDKVVIRTNCKEKLRKIKPVKHIILLSAIGAWAILYLIYVLTHEIPVNPAGFYLESTSQLISHGFRLPKTVSGFGENGIPYAYPPLGFYVLAATGYLFGGVVRAALYIPGILLPIQAIAAYSFVKRWKASEQAAQWAGVVLLLMPHIFFRTLFGDGITTGLAGVFLLLSWRCAIAVDKPGFSRTSVIGGLFVGMSFLSHPAIGVFCAVTFTLLLISETGFNLTALSGLVASGITAIAITLPWLLTVTTIHGFDPILAGMQDSKGPLSLSQGLKTTLLYIYDKHTGDVETLAMLLFPVPIAILYNIIQGPRVIFLLLIAGLFTFKGHPSVSMFAFALSIGTFYNDILFPAFNRKHIRGVRQEPEQNPPGGSWVYLLFAGAHIIALFLLCLPYTVNPTFAPGEKETYDWISANTAPDATFVMEDIAENLVYFGRRTILLPVLGAEWIPSPEFGNGLLRNRLVKYEIYACRQPECLSNVFSKYNVTPDYLIYRISDASEQAWIDELSASSYFEVVFSSEAFIILRRIESGAQP